MTISAIARVIGKQWARLFLAKERKSDEFDPLASVARWGHKTSPVLYSHPREVQLSASKSHYPDRYKIAHPGINSAKLRKLIASIRCSGDVLESFAQCFHQTAAAVYGQGVDK